MFSESKVKRFNETEQSKDRCLIDRCESACTLEGFTYGDYNRTKKYRKEWLSCLCLKDYFLTEIILQDTMFNNSCDNITDKVILTPRKKDGGR
jgi:hypothetical protein